MHYQLNKRKGITPIIATIVLLFITMALLVMAYTLFWGMGGSLAQKCIQIPATLPPTCEEGEIDVYLYNCGSEPITPSSLDFISLNGTDLTGSMFASYLASEPIPPQKSVKFIENFDCNNPEESAPCGGVKEIAIGAGSNLQKASVNCGEYTIEDVERIRLRILESDVDEVQPILAKDGFVYSFGMWLNKPLILKTDQELSLTCPECNAFVYGGYEPCTYCPVIVKAVMEESYIYAIAGLDSYLNRDILLMKIDIEDLSVVSSKLIAGTSAEFITDAKIFGDYIYLTGFKTSGSIGVNDGLILKINKYSLDVESAKVIGTSTSEMIKSILVDTGKIYISGNTQSSTGWFTVLDENLNLLISYKTSVYGIFNDATSDESHIYLVGGLDFVPYDRRPSIIKINRDDYSVNSAIQYASGPVASSTQEMVKIIMSADSIYVGGNLEYDKIIGKHDKQSLNYLGGKILGLTESAAEASHLVSIDTTTEKIYITGYNAYLEKSLMAAIDPVFAEGTFYALSSTGDAEPGYAYQLYDIPTAPSHIDITFLDYTTSVSTANVALTVTPITMIRSNPTFPVELSEPYIASEYLYHF